MKAGISRARCWPRREARHCLPASPHQLGPRITVRGSPTPRSNSATTSPYSGPASAYGVYGTAQTAYFQMINDQGGINGRKINLISLDTVTIHPSAWSRRASLSKKTTCWLSPASRTAPNTSCRSISRQESTESVPHLRRRPLQ